MAIEKTIDINVNASDAITDLNLLNNILEEQEQITIELREEQQKLERQLADTPKSSLAAQKKYNDQLKHVKNSLKDQTLSVKKLKLQQSQLSKGTSNLTEDLISNGGAMGLLNELTGGLAQKFKDSFEAISLSSKGLGGFKRAMLATGIGALVVGVGLLVANFDKVKEFLGGISEETKKARENIEKEMLAMNQSIAKQSVELKTVAKAYQSGALRGEDLARVVENLNEKYGDSNLQLDENNNLTAESLVFIDQQIESIKIQARNKSILTNIERLYSDELEAQTVIGKTNIALMEEAAVMQELIAKQKASTDDKGGFFTLGEKEQIQTQIDASKLRQKQIASELSTFIAGRAKIQEAIDKETERLDFTEFIKPSKSKVEKTATEASDSYKEKLKQIAEEAQAFVDEEEFSELIGFADALTGTTQEEEEKETDAFTKAEEEALALRNKYELLNMTELEQLNFQEALELSKVKNTESSEAARTEIEEFYAKKREKISKGETKTKEIALRATSSILSDLSSVMGAQTSEAKAMGIAAATIDTYIGMNKALKDETIPNTFARIAAMVTVGINGFKQVKQIASVKIPNEKGGVGAAGGGGDVTIAQPPQFNIVGASDTNQLADAIGGQIQQPVQAFVVANDVTTAQSLENNIVEGATL
tara:strand:- start:179 stop:2134 length:1956 start_codon:yes stop_codon:yes gene_type:complete